MLAIESEGLTIVTKSGNVIQHPAAGGMNRAHDKIVKLLKEMGLTPASRPRIPTPPRVPNRAGNEFFNDRTVIKINSSIASAACG